MNIFLIQAMGDEIFSDPLRADLLASGIKVSSARDFVQPGESWIGKITSAIKSADVIIVVVSVHLARSQSCSAEIALAVSEAKNHPTKRIIPVLCDKSSSVPFFLTDIQWVDLSSQESYRRNLPELIRALHEPTREVWPVEQLEKMKADYLLADRAVLEADVANYKERHAGMMLTIAELFATGSISIIIASFITLMVLSLFGIANVRINSWFFFGVLAGVVASLAAPFVLRELDAMVASLFRRDGTDKDGMQRNE